MPAFTPDSLPSLSGKVYFVTGGNAGIGYQTVLYLSKKHAKVYMGARSETKGRAAIASIQELVPDADVHLMILDHMNLSSVAAAAKEFSLREAKLHGLVLNAGIMAVPFETSQDGYESQWQTNYISHWLLTYHLLPTLLTTARASRTGDVRIVDVTSGGHKRFAPKDGIAFDDINQVHGGVWSRYGQSKLGNILHAKYLNTLYGPDGSRKEECEIWTAAVHPGNYYTDLSKNAQFMGPVSPIFGPILNCLGAFSPVEQGAYTSVFCVASQEFGGNMSGEYLEPVAKIGTPSKAAKNTKLAKKLWSWTEAEMRRKDLL